MRFFSFCKNGDVPAMKKVAVIMGSDSDLETMRPCMKRLSEFGVPF